MEPDILQCEVKWALGSITINKSSGGNRIPAELFKILKDDTVKVLHSICQQIWKTQQWPQDWKWSVFIPIPKVNAEECSNYWTFVVTSHASKVMLKMFQARLQLYLNWKLSDVQAGFRKDRGARDQIANSAGSKRKQGDSRKTSASLTMLKPLTVWITTNWKILKQMGVPDHFTCLLRNLYAGQKATFRTEHWTMNWLQI